MINLIAMKTSAYIKMPRSADEILDAFVVALGLVIDNIFFVHNRFVQQMAEKSRFHLAQKSQLKMLKFLDPFDHFCLSFTSGLQFGFDDA